MPLYEYQCPQCQHRCEEWVKSPSDQGEEPCPKCGTASPRIMSQTSFVLKGGGWYVDDYGYRKGIKDEGASSASSTSEASSPSGAGEASPAPASGGEKAGGSAAPSPAAKAPAAAPAPTSAPKPAPTTAAPKASAAKPAS